MTLRTLNYGNYGIFLIMGHAGFCPSAVLSFSLGLGGGLPIVGPGRLVNPIVRILGCCLG